jgi:sugar phosphate isomerase/epimerase
MSVLPGLVSVTFRRLTPARVVLAAAQAGLRGIEWGGDVHVPHGDIVRAREVRKITEDAGLSVASYGSYYRFEESVLPFARVLETAVELGAPAIRVWAGTQGSAAATPEYRSTIATGSRRIAELAASAGIVVCFEFHGETLTDRAESARNLLLEADHPNLRSFWQPPNNRSLEYCRDGLRTILPWLEHIHCFHWRGSENERRPLSEGARRWQEYLRIAATAPPGEVERPEAGSLPGATSRWILLEFVANDSIETFMEDATTLHGWIGPAVP